MGELLWLEPVREGSVPVTSVFFSSGGFVLSTFVLGTFDPLRRQKAYLRILDALLKRTHELSFGDVRIKHSILSRKIVGTEFSSYSYPRPPDDFSASASFAEIIADQQALHGELAEQDKLKLIFQAVYGSEHLLSAAQSAWRSFKDEWDSLDFENAEPFAERISPEGDLYRINLRPAKELGIAPEIIFDAVKRSAACISADLSRRQERILPQSRSVGIKPGMVPRVPVHHSTAYKTSQAPAYRLLLSFEITGLLKDAN